VRLTEERIVAAVLELVDEEGLEAVTMRRLADALGVRAPSLYKHMRSKQALLDAAADAVLRQVDTSGFLELDWRPALERWASSYYDVLVAHRNLVPHLAVAFGHLPAGLAQADRVFAGLRRAGWSASRATRIAFAVRYAVYGAALGSFASSFDERAELFANLGDVPRMRRDSARIERAALDLLLSSLFDGAAALAPDGRP
jgi:AcrR family transcriptional regulator